MDQQKLSQYEIPQILYDDDDFAVGLPTLLQRTVKCVVTKPQKTHEDPVFVRHVGNFYVRDTDSGELVQSFDEANPLILKVGLLDEEQEKDLDLCYLDGKSDKIIYFRDQHENRSVNYNKVNETYKGYPWFGYVEIKEWGDRNIGWGN